MSGALKCHDSLVLGALGCGAFCTPPAQMARLFHEVLSEAEFQDRPADNRNLLHHRGCAEKLYLPCPAQYLLHLPEGSHKIRFLRSQRLRLLRISLCSSFLFDLLVSTLIE